MARVFLLAALLVLPFSLACETPDTQPAPAPNFKEKGESVSNANSAAAAGMAMALIEDELVAARLPADSLVAWRVWSPAVLEEARASARPIFLHIGYATCHWCSLMAASAFVDPTVAERLERDFVPVFVDRDVRPEVAGVYMKAFELLSRTSGWPANLVLTPEGFPFGATGYLPARSTDGVRPGLINFLDEASTAWADDPDAVRERAFSVVATLRLQAERSTEGEVPDAASTVHQTTGFLASSFDQANGGFGNGAKFPRPVVLDLLLRSLKRSADPIARSMLEGTLDAMAAAPFRDQLGGGFHRYTRDPAWRRPELEKTLEDNAQLAGVYLGVARLLDRDEFAQIAAEILDDIDRTLSAPGGGFYSSLGASASRSNGVPSSMGAYYTWSGSELRAALGGSDSGAFDRHYGLVGLESQDQRRMLLAVSVDFEGVARSLGIGVAAATDAVVRARARLLASRRQRPQPVRDEQVVAVWNGLAIGAFARASRGLREQRYADRAARAATFVLDELWDTTSLRRLSWREASGGVAVLDDYAFMAEGLLDLFEVDPDPRWLVAVEQLLDAAVLRFWDDERAAFRFATEVPATGLPVLWPSDDDTRASGNAVMLRVLLRVAALTGDRSHADLAARALHGFGRVLSQRPIEAPGLVGALEIYDDSPVQAAILLPDNAGSAAMFYRELESRYLPNADIIVASGDRLRELAPALPWLSLVDFDRDRVSGWVCRGTVCGLPTRDPAQFGAALDRVLPLPTN
ncbi:MAG: hypothetical protein ACI8TX_001410 [Hyphomicrobiaceae bacterium]|jgi:uncharacterized protein YyaL (SSP411 family)